MTNLIKLKKTFLFIALIVAVALLFPVFVDAVSVEPGQALGDGGGSIFTGGDDSKCTSRGGTCQTNTSPSSCSGNYQAGLCSGPAERQCCIPSQSKSGGQLIGSGQSKVITIPNPLGVRTFGELILTINRWLLYIGIPIFTLMIFIGAFQLMVSGGSPENVTKGRHTITWAVIGYALLLLSTGLISIIKDVFLVR